MHDIVSSLKSTYDVFTNVRSQITLEQTHGFLTLDGFQFPSTNTISHNKKKKKTIIRCEMV